MPGATDTVYVYGVSSSTDFDSKSVQGVEGAEIRIVEHDGLAALTSRIEGGRLAARDLRAHWRVLEQAFERATVLPVRFGTVMEDEVAVRELLLEPNREWLSDQLAQLRGLSQMNVKGHYDEDELLTEIVLSTPAIAKLRERTKKRSTPAEQFQLGQMVEAAVSRRRIEDTEVALAKLETLAVAARAEEVAHPAAFNIALLVEARVQRGLDEAVGSLREQFGRRIELRYVGPLPPFSFAQASVDGSGAWA